MESFQRVRAKKSKRSRKVCNPDVEGEVSPGKKFSLDDQNWSQRASR